MSIKINKCHKCRKKTDIICAKCNIAICSQHTYSTNKRFYCADCFLRERKIGLYKGLFGMFAILMAGLIAIIIIKY